MNSLNATSVSTSSSSAPIRAPLQELPKELFNLVTKWLKQNEIARLPELSQEINQLTVFARRQVKHLDISYNPKRTEMSPEHLRNALQQHPNFNSIDIGGYEPLSLTMQAILIEAFSTRVMKGFYVPRTSLEGRVPSWKAMFEALSNKLEHIDFTGIWFSADRNQNLQLLSEFASRYGGPLCLDNFFS